MLGTLRDLAIRLGTGAPAGSNDAGPMLGIGGRRHCLVARLHGACPDATHQSPRERAVHKELGLLTFLDLTLAPIGGGNGPPVYLVQIIHPVAEMGIESAGVRETERPAASRLLSPNYDLFQVRFQMHDRALPCLVCQFRGVPAMKQVQHHRTRTEVERYVLTHSGTRVARHAQSLEPALLDVPHSDRG